MQIGVEAERGGRQEQGGVMMTLADRLRRYSQGKDTAMGNDLIKAADQIERLEKKYETLLEDVRGACGCTDGDDIRKHLEEYL